MKDKLVFGTEELKDRNKIFNEIKEAAFPGRKDFEGVRIKGMCNWMSIHSIRIEGIQVSIQDRHRRKIYRRVMIKIDKNTGNASIDLKAIRTKFKELAVLARKEKERGDKIRKQYEKEEIEKNAFIAELELDKTNIEIYR
ncbi:MAG: hypothetical protein SV062_07380, partial [Thermodesulfobacteriota bacterium]|nr:hypothetical protein [Thermodesulfobacteriota bacterium]